jgi:hypothetical protein
MTRQDLYSEYADVIFALVPHAREADEQVSREDVESLRLKLVAITDRVAMTVAADTEFTPDDAADAALELEQEHEDAGRD